MCGKHGDRRAELNGAIFVNEFHGCGSGDGGANHCVDVQLRFGLVESARCGAKCRIARQKDRAAIVVGLGGNFVRSDFASGRKDVLLICAYERTKDGQFRCAIDGDEIPESLRSHLAEAVSSDEGESAVAHRAGFGDAEHHPAIEEYAVFFRGKANDFALGGVEGHAEKPGVNLVRDELAHQFGGDVERRFPGLRAASVEMHKAEVRAALDHLVGGNGGIESPREKTQHPACGVCRKSADAVDFVGIHERWARSDFDEAGDVRIFQANRSGASGGAQFFLQVPADFFFDGDAGMRKRLITALGTHSEGTKVERTHFVPGSGRDGVEVAVHIASDRKERNTGDKLQPSDCFVKRCGGAEPHDHAVASLLDHHERNSL